MKDNVVYTSRAMCVYHDITINTLSEMVKYGVARPRGNKPEKWLFSELDYKRIEMASNYYHHMKLEPVAAVVALDLCDDLAYIKR